MTRVRSLLGRVRAGGAVLLAAGLAALGFEAVFHFVVSNPDHVATVDHGRALFTWTAALSTLGDLALALAGALLVRRHP